jgi:hypothetical protein
MNGSAQLIAAENDRLALEWAGPFGYALLQVIRRGEDFSEADFQALLAQGAIAHTRAGRPVASTAPEGAGEPPFGTLSTRSATVPTGGVQTPPSEPPPPSDYYRVAAQASPGGRPPRTRPLRPTSTGPVPLTSTTYRPAGERDASGRIVKRI